MSAEVYALRFGQRDPMPNGSAFYRRLPGDTPPAMDFYVWAVVPSEGQPIVIDTGFTADAVTRRSAPDQLLDNIEDLLAAIGIQVAAVETVVLTHLHYDHAGDVGLFPNARFIVQEKELSFWTGRFAGRPGTLWTIEPNDIVDVLRLNFAGRLIFVDGDREIAPGISVHLVGGHAPGLQVVRVETAGGPVVIASDAAHYYTNLDQDRPFAILDSIPAAHSAFDRIRQLAGTGGLLVPGHDPLVRERFPAAAPGLEGRVIRIA